VIIKQDIIEVENRIDFIADRYPMPVERTSGEFIDVNMHTLSAGVPSQLLQYRPDIRQAERELAAAGLDVKLAPARFLPALIITCGLGYEAFNPKYLVVTPEALIGNIAGGLVAPLINNRAIQADFLSPNARQMQSAYNHQRVILNAFTEVINRVSLEEKYCKSIEIKKQKLNLLEASVDAASKLWLMQARW
jgi:outer membrane protein, multidrug efflux system